MFITLIICLTIVALASMVCGWFIWFFNFTSESGKTKQKNKYDEKYLKALKEFDKEVAENKAIAEKAIKDRDIYIEAMERQSKAKDEIIDRYVAAEQKATAEIKIEEIESQE